MKYNQLDKQAKERAREWYRDCSALDGHDFDHILDEWKEILGFLGFYDVTIFYSGFCSQGDGACFTGRWYLGDINYPKLEAFNKEFAEKYGSWFNEIHALYKLGAHDHHRVLLEHQGRYQHEHSIIYQYDLPSLWDDDDSDPKDIPDFQDRFPDECRELMRAIYKQLEEEYEWRTSDECVEEAIIMNEYDFNKKGEAK